MTREMVRSNPLSAGVKWGIAATGAAVAVGSYAYAISNAKTLGRGASEMLGVGVIVGGATAGAAAGSALWKGRPIVGGVVGGVVGFLAAGMSIVQSIGYSG